MKSNGFTLTPLQKASAKNLHTKSFGEGSKVWGFTLIELLVTIAIIGILASVAVATFSGQTKKARDAKRKGDIATIQQALELYYEKQGTYKVPRTGYNQGGQGWANYEGGTYTKSLVHQLFDEGLMSVAYINDPTPNKLNNNDPRMQYMIYPRPNGDIANGYCLYSFLENSADPDYGSYGSYTTDNKMRYRICGGGL